MNLQKRIFYTVLSTHLLLLLAVAIYMSIPFDSQLSPLAKELHLAHSSWLMGLDHIKHLTAKAKKKSQIEKKVTPDSSKNKNTFFTTMPFIESTLLSGEERREDSLLKKYGLSLPHEVLVSDFKYFAQMGSLETLHVISPQQVPHAKKNPFVLINWPLQKSPLPPAVFYTLTESSPQGKTLSLYSDFSADTAKKIIPLLHETRGIYQEAPAPNTFYITLGGEKYLTTYTNFIKTAHIEQRFYTSLLLTHFRTIEKKSIALIALALFFIVSHLLIWGYKDTQSSQQTHIKKRSAVLILLSTNILFFISSLFILNPLKSAPTLPADSAALPYAIDNLHKALFANQDMSSFFTDSFRTDPIDFAPSFSERLDLNTQNTPLSLFLQSTGFRFHIFSLDHKAKITPLYSQDTSDVFKEFLQKTKTIASLDSWVSGPDNASPSGPIVLNFNHQDWLVFPKKIMSQNNRHYLALYTLPKNIMTSDLSALLKATSPVFIAFALNILSLWLFAFLLRAFEGVSSEIRRKGSTEDCGKRL